MRVQKFSAFQPSVSLKASVDDVGTPTSRQSQFGAEKFSLRMVLRAATAADHMAVDDAFSRFDLTSRQSYARFLQAHARAVAPLEQAATGLLTPSRARYPLLQADLADLGVDSLAAECLTVQDDGEGWGIVYVLEGSRLGGSILAKRVSAGLPTRYLSAAHEDGSWRRFAESLERAGSGQGIAWSNAAISGAKSAFARFADAALSG